MMKNYLLLLVLCCISTVSKSHQFLSEVIIAQDPSSNYEFTVVEYFELFQNDIESLNSQEYSVEYTVDRQNNLLAMRKTSEDSCENRGYKTCGQFDHFSQARSAAIITCYNLLQQSPDIYPSPLIPRFIGPGSFVESQSASLEHHLNYTLNQGISFECGYFSQVSSTY
jgi:hypothetical protein